MAAGALSRGLAVLQCMVGTAGGVPLTRIAESVGLPKSAAHRTLVNLIEEGFVHQLQPSGNYALTLRIVGIGLRHLAGSTIVGLATPALTRLATESGQLVRLGLVDDRRLLWVAKAQGARAGLRYEPDPDHGSEIPYASSASGLAWLSRLPDEDALRLVASQAADERHPVGHNAPRTLAEVADRIRDARATGWAWVHDSFEDGISAMAAPLVDVDGAALGVLSVAGPSLQLTDARMAELAPRLLDTAGQLSGLAAGLTHELRSHTATVQTDR